MNILLTGANGFIGRALSASMLECGHFVRGSLRRPQHEEKLVSGVDWFVSGPIDGNTDWKAALPEIQVVVHLAARVHIMNDHASDPLLEFRKVNVDGTISLARQAAEAGVKRFVFMSSIKVNGEGRKEPYQESDHPAPQDAYAISKWEAEQGLMAIALETRMEVVIIRPPLVYGPGVKGNFVAMMNWVRMGIPLPLGAVHNRRSLLAQENLVDFIALCADRDRSPSAANEVFLISDDEDVSTTELLHKVARAHGRKALLFPVPAAWLRLSSNFVGKGEVADRLLETLVINSSKARDLLGWNPVITMDEQLRKMARDAEIV